MAPINNNDRQLSTDTSTAGQSMSRRQRFSAVKTGQRSNNPDAFRMVSQVNARITRQSSYTGNCELDSHADTLVAGANFVVLEYTDASCSVSPFFKTYESKENEATGVTYILILGQALCFGVDVESSLLCPNQLCANGVIVDDIPVHLSHN